jgi:hypothetical protein
MQKASLDLTFEPFEEDTLEIEITGVNSNEQ